MNTTDGAVTIEGREFQTLNGEVYVDIVADYFGDDGDDWIVPEGWEVSHREHLSKDDTYSWHEHPERLFLRPLPPPVTCDVAPVTHHMDLSRFAA